MTQLFGKLFGGLLAALGLFGVYNASMSFGKPPVVREDLTAVGTVTDLYVNQVVHRLTKVVLNNDFQMKYTFTAADGKEYTDQETLTEEQFRGLSIGQELEVRYNSHSPSICGSVDYGVYVSVKEFPEKPPLTRLMVSLGILAFGGAMFYFASRSDESDAPERAGNALANDADEDPMAKFRRLAQASAHS